MDSFENEKPKIEIVDIRSAYAISTVLALNYVLCRFTLKLNAISDVQTSQKMISEIKNKTKILLVNPVHLVQRTVPPQRINIVLYEDVSKILLRSLVSSLNITEILS